MNMIHILKYLLPVIIFTAPCMGYDYIEENGKIRTCASFLGGTDSLAGCQSLCTNTYGASGTVIPCPLYISGIDTTVLTSYCCVDSIGLEIMGECVCPGTNYITKYNLNAYPPAYYARDISVSGNPYVEYELHCDGSDRVCHCNMNSYGNSVSLETAVSRGDLCKRCPSIALINSQTNQVTVLQGHTRTYDGGTTSFPDTSITDCFVGDAPGVPDDRRTKYKDGSGTFMYTDFCDYVQNGSGQ